MLQDNRRIKKNCVRKEKEENKMKKIMALLAVVTILTGSIGMAVSAAVDPNTCIHPDDNIPEIPYETPYTVTSTHPVWVANKPNGEPILATCTITATWQKYRVICGTCGHVFSEKKKKISETHSMHH